MSNIELRAQGRTHTGNVREANEDALLIDADVGFYAVLDGMGGTTAGDIASSKARDVIREYVRARHTSMAPAELLDAAIQSATAAVHAEASARRDRKGMGTTVVACLVVDHGARAFIAHVGDSRAYLCRDSRLQQLTRDHTVVAELLASGAISAEEAVHHPYKSVLSRNLGSKPQARVDVQEVALRPGDRILMCSDGLHGYAAHDAVEQIVAGSEDARGAAEDLIELALRGGGGDNVTVVLVEAGERVVPRATQVIRAQGSVAWGRRRDVFLAAAHRRGLPQSPICSMLPPAEALEVVAGNLCDAVFHDLQHTTGINVWTYAQNLAIGWLDQGGHYQVLRDLFDILRAAAIDVIANVHAAGDPFAMNLDTAVTRALVVAEMAVGGVLAERLRRVEAQLVRRHTEGQRAPSAADITITDQPTMPYMEAVRVDPPTPAVADCLGKARGLAHRQIETIGARDGARDVIERAHAAALEPAGPTDAMLAAREIFGARPLDESGVTPLLDALDQARTVHLHAVRQLDAPTDIEAAALRRLAVAHRKMSFSIAGLVVEASHPITDQLHAAVEETRRLRERLARGESKLAELERKLVTRIDPHGSGALFKRGQT